jgi:hypothetical protein
MKRRSFSPQFIRIAFAVFINSLPGLFLHAQKIPVQFGKLSAADFTLPASPAVDSNAAAVIVADYGETSFKGNANGWISYVLKKKKRIKIINKQAFDLATVTIPLYTDDEQTEKLDDITATAYNLEGEKVVSTKLERKELFSEKIDKNRVIKKFTIPGVRENSIIEYSYTIISDFYFNIPYWEFQDTEYPTLWSEYQVSIPSLVSYVFNKRGYHAFFIDKADEGKENYTIRQSKDSRGMSGAEQTFNVNTYTVKHRWVMKDVNAFGHEKFLYSPENYQDQIDFQLSKIYDGQDTKDVKNTWAKQNEDMLKDADFGRFMDPDEDMSWLDDVLKPIINPNASRLEQAKQVYYFVADNFTCTDHHHRYMRYPLREIVKAKKGNVAEINLLLTALLRRLHIEAAPVVLSTRQAGINYDSYPVLSRLDYVICRFAMDDVNYFLDASQHELGFGHLPADCFNGHGRIISATETGPVYLTADTIKEVRNTMVHFTAGSGKDKSLAGTCTVQYGHLESFNHRHAIAEKGLPAFFQTIAGNGGDEWAMKESWVDSLDKREFPLTAHFNVTWNSFGNNDLVYLSPFLWGGYKSNPFSAAERRYPVEMSYPINESYYFNFDIPEGYTVDEMPKSLRASYNVKDGSFEYLIQRTDNAIQLKSTLVLKKAIFDPEDYASLRDFFALVVKKQAEQIVFKKIK